jgi:isopentenyl diphosphate isomerase/L-lactate dehydrogenase-like FMN-dependent dehydrogenase
LSGKDFSGYFDRTVLARSEWSSWEGEDRVIAPTGSNRAFHPDGEVAVANAARVGNHLQILSSGATTSIEDAIAARGAPVWFQIYARNWEVTEALVRRAARAGSPVVVITVDGWGADKLGNVSSFAAHRYAAMR